MTLGSITYEMGLTVAANSTTQTRAQCLQRGRVSRVDTWFKPGQFGVVFVGGWVETGRGTRVGFITSPEGQAFGPGGSEEALWTIEPDIAVEPGDTLVVVFANNDTEFAHTLSVHVEVTSP